MRVVCEFCKTVYNIPDAKLVREVSQATCKVCQNKILIRRPPEGTPADEIVPAPAIAAPRPAPGPGRDDAEANEPTVADPGPPPRVGPPGARSSSLAAAQADTGGPLGSLPEQELSNSWREAIVDNRETVAMLKNLGIPGPAENSTAEGPAVRPAAPVGAHSPASGAAPPDAGEENEATVASPELRRATREGKLELASTRPPAPAATRIATTPRPGLPSGSSRFLALSSGLAGTGIAAALVHDGAWAAGLSGWLAFGAATFVAIASLLNALLRGPGARAVLAVGAIAAVTAVAAMLAVFLTGGPRTRVLAEAHPFLAPLARFEIHLREAPPTPAPRDPPE